MELGGIFTGAQILLKPLVEMDATALTRIRRGLALAAKGPVTLPGSRTGDAVPEARFATAAVQYRGVEVKPCCTESVGPEVLRMTFENPVGRAFELDAPIIMFGAGSIDLGNGVLVPFTGGGGAHFTTLQGNTVIVYSSVPTCGILYLGALITDIEFAPTARFSNLVFNAPLEGPKGQLTNVDLKGITVGTSGQIYFNNHLLTNIDLGTSTFIGINLSDNNLETLDLSSKTDIININVRNNPSISLLLPPSSNSLRALDVGNCNLSSLVTRNYPTLTGLSCGLNSLTSLDLSGNIYLTSLTCSDNDITTLNLTDVSGLTYIECGGNQLTALDVSTLTSLTDLVCSGNQISALDLSGLGNLVNLTCIGNDMISLTITECFSLQNLQCANNNFSQSVANQILFDLNVYGQEGGTLSFEENATTLYYNITPEVETAYTSLIGKGWTITGLFYLD